MFNALTAWLAEPAGLTPHGFCLLWEPGLIWTYAISDAGIALAYFTIPFALAVVAHRRHDLVFRPLLWLFAGFILLCGTTHVFDVLTLWVPAYGLEGVVKAATAAVSIVTAVALWRLVPQGLVLPSPTQLREANTALRESEARYRASFEQSPVPTNLINEDGVIVGVSRSWLALLGYTEQEVLGRHLTEFRPPGAETWVDGDKMKLMAEGEIHDLERRYLHRNGTTVEVLLSARLERREGTFWIVSVLIDVTERRREQEALRASEERLAQARKMEAVGQLTGGIAHDFNNILQSIAGGLEIMERRIAQGRAAEAVRLIEGARKAADRATALTNRMLAFGRRQALQPTVISPDALLNGMLDLIQTGVGPAVRVELFLDDSRWSTSCDASQLESALLNLVVNARDAMTEGGTLRFITADRSLSAADLADQDYTQPGDYLEIAVADTGAGMSADVLRRAFEPFFTTRPFGQGTGLGLSQVYGFVRQSGGFVRLESKPGHGTTVRLYLPRRDGVEVRPAVSSAAPAAGQTVNGGSSAPGGQTVLVVEDEEAIREMIAEMLRDHGYVVLEAEDGPSGLRIVQSTMRMDLLVSDVGLPGLNGRQLADAARASRPGLPVLLITGYAGSVLDEMGLGPGMQMLRKPFGLGTLKAHVRDMIDGSAVRQEN